jgi:glucans biosynthesis protein C
MNRRHDIDWIRVITIGLLLIYHTAISFQPWGGFVGFITNLPSWESLWIPMTMLNIWRIPILFFVSGMGLFLAMQNRNWKQLLSERLMRLGIPLLFGSLAIVPLHWLLLQFHYQITLRYNPSMGHLWFLGNILLYVVIFLPFFYYLKYKNQGKIALLFKRVFSRPLSFILILACFILESIIIKPPIFEMYAFTLHGLILGALAFFFGFLMMYCGEQFWQLLLTYKWIFLIVAVGLFTKRYSEMPSNVPVYLLSIESNSWIFTVLGFGFQYLNRGGKTLNYLKEAAYPVYILHMAFLFLGSVLIFPLKMNIIFKFILLLAFTFAGSLVFYELTVRRFNLIRGLFGLKKK